MDLETALQGMNNSRKALQTLTGDNPSEISQQMHLLAQYTSIVEEILADKEEAVSILISTAHNEERSSGKSEHAASVAAKQAYTAELAENARISRLITSSWRLVSASQSRLKHLVAEANNQM